MRVIEVKSCREDRVRIWRDVAGYEGLYRVSDHGEVFSVRKNRMMKPVKFKGGYRKICLTRPPRQFSSFLIHRLVLEAFVGPCPAGYESRHMNGVPHDNRLANLSWTDHATNCRDKVRHGTHQSGESNGLSKLKRSEVREIKAHLHNGRTRASLGRQYGVSVHAIRAIAIGKTWRHVEFCPLKEAQS